MLAHSFYVYEEGGIIPLPPGITRGQMPTSHRYRSDTGDE